jgi:hypothetical protein
VPDRSATRGALTSVAAVIGLGLGVAACGGGSGGEEEAAPWETSVADTTGDTALPSCRDVQRAVVFSVFGAATTGEGGEATTWMDDPEAMPEARPGVAELATAYRDIGYQVMYVTLLPSETLVGDQPMVDAVTVWLGLNGFPVGEGARVWAPEGEGAGDPSVALIEELARMGATGADFEAGYAGDQEMVFPLAAGGVPGDKVFMLGATGGDEPSDSETTATPLPDGDLVAHVTEVQALEPICE